MDLISESINGNIENIKKLLLNGADVNLQTEYGETALMWASAWARLKVVKMLLQNGANVNLQTKYGWNALIIVTGMNHLEMNHLEIVKLLLLNDADLNIQNNCGNTALYKALINGRLEMVKLLNRGTEMEEWRPWNHCNLSNPYRDAMSTLLLLAKIKMNYNRLFNTITIYYGSYIRVSKGQYREC